MEVYSHSRSLYSRNWINYLTDQHKYHHENIRSSALQNQKHAETQLLDKVYKLGAKNDSKLKRVAQGFDQKTGEHVIRLEYRVRAANQNKLPPKPQKVKLNPTDDTKK